MYCKYDKTQEVYHESDSLDAKRYDILYGIDPLSAVIEDRSIARTWPITSWSMEISTNNFRLSWYPTMTCTVTSPPDYWTGQDTQSFFVPLTGRLWRYGDYCISMLVTAGALDLFSKSVETSSVTTTLFDPRNPCTNFLNEGVITFARDVSTSIHTNLSTYGEWLSTGYVCYDPTITMGLSSISCPEGYTGNMTISAEISTTHFSFYSLTGSWSIATSAACIINADPDPETDPLPIGPILMNNAGGGEISKDYIGRYAFNINADYGNMPTSINPSAAWHPQSRYSSMTGAGLPYGYNYLNGLIVEAIYLHTTEDLSELPVGYSHPCTSIIGKHYCDRAYFETWAINSTADKTITLYLCSAKGLYGQYNPHISSPHIDATWIRLTKYNKTYYNECPSGLIHTIPWATTTTTTPEPTTTTTTLEPTTTTTTPEPTTTTLEP